MKITLRSFTLEIALLILFLPMSVMAQGNDRQAVDLVMQKMIRAFEANDATLMFEVVRRDAVVVGYSAGGRRLVTQSAEDWAKPLTGEIAEDEAQRHRSYEIVEVTEGAAVVRLMLDYPRWRGQDYLALSKIDGKWMIISKSWSGQVKPSAS